MKLISSDFPNDATGDTLRAIELDGSDLLRPMDIEFFISVPSSDVGEKILKQIKFSCKEKSIDFDDEYNEYTVSVIKNMDAVYSSVVALEQILSDLAERFEANYEGFETEGNNRRAG